MKGKGGERERRGGREKEREGREMEKDRTCQLEEEELLASEEGGGSGRGLSQDRPLQVGLLHINHQLRKYLT